MRLLHRQAGNRLEYAVDFLDLVYYQRSDRVDVWGFADGDDVVLVRDRVRRRDAADAFHLLRDLERAPRRCIDQDIGLHSLTPTICLADRNVSPAYTETTRPSARLEGADHHLVGHVGSGEDCDHLLIRRRAVVI